MTTTTYHPAGPIPVHWQTTEAQVDALLGQAGRPVLIRELERLNHLAAQQQWPLQRISIEYYQDPEICCEQYLILVLAFDCERDEAKQYFQALLDSCDEVQKGLQGQEKEIYRDLIEHDFTSGF